MKLSQTNGPLYHYYGDDLTAMMDHIKNAGFRYVDVSFMSRYMPGSRYFTTDNAVLADEYRRALEHAELTPVQSHEPSGNALGEDFGAYYLKKSTLAIDLAGRIGIPSITLHPGLPDKRPMTREEYLEESAKIYKQLIPLAEKYGIRLLIENLPWRVPSEGCQTCNADELNELLDRIDHPLFGACWDVGHGNIRRLNQYEEIKKLGARLQGLHVHDNYANRRLPNRDLHQIPFWGEVNFDAVITALKEIDYQGYFNFEVDVPTAREDIKPFEKNGVVINRLQKPSPALRLEMDKLLFAAGRHMLTTYDCFSE